MDKQRQPGNNGMRKPRRVVGMKIGLPHHAPQKQKQYVNNKQLGLHHSSAPAKPHSTKEHTMQTLSVHADQIMQKKLFVLDTNVLMHDWNSLLQFQEHDIYIPIMVIRELDRNKKGHEEAAWNSRRASNFIESLIKIMEARDSSWTFKDGLALEYAEGGSSTMGRIYIQTDDEAFRAARLATKDSNITGDDNIINTAQLLINTRGKQYAEIRLVSKDLNMRILARSRELLTDDYTSDRVSTEGDKGIYSGMIALPEALGGRVQIDHSSNADTILYEIEIPDEVVLYANQLVTDDTNGVGWIVSQVRENVAEIRHSKNFIAKNPMFGINARNREQNYTLNVLMNPEIDLITILGDAGTGKTLLSIVAALEQKRTGIYNGIIFTRATVPVGGEEIGFLPGNEHEKMGSWLGALEDNLEVISEAMLAKQHDGDKIKLLKDKHARTTGGNDDTEWVRNDSISILHREFNLKSLSFMRGRTFLRKYLIIDEAQNLTPKKMKTLITRAGPGTKIVCLGNLGQIDTPYITETSSGLAYAVDRFSGWKHYAHITLNRGERSRLAEYAVEVM